MSSKVVNVLKNNSLLVKLAQNHVRCYNSNSNNGIKYHGFTYYPRFPDKADPPYEATKLFMVKKIRQAKAIQRVERRILEHLKLDGKMSQVAVVKNTPENNMSLYKIKHLVQIQPLTFPNGPPTENDLNSLGATFLNEFGEMRVTPRLEPINVKQIEEFKDKKLGGETLRRVLNNKWRRGADI